jgi:hypothetical protein
VWLLFGRRAAGKLFSLGVKKTLALICGCCIVRTVVDNHTDKEADMVLHHKTIPGKRLIIEPNVDSNFPRHGAFLSERVGDKAIFSALKASQEECIQYAKKYGYDVPFGF